MSKSISWPKVCGAVAASGIALLLFSGLAKADTLTIIQPSTTTEYVGTINSVHQDATGGIVWFSQISSQSTKNGPAPVTNGTTQRWWWRIDRTQIGTFPGGAITGSAVCAYSQSGSDIILDCQ